MNNEMNDTRRSTAGKSERAGTKVHQEFDLFCFFSLFFFQRHPNPDAQGIPNTPILIYVALIPSRILDEAATVCQVFIAYYDNIKMLQGPGNCGESFSIRLFDKH